MVTPIAGWRAAAFKRPTMRKEEGDLTEYETAALAISQARVWVALGQVAISGIGLGAILWGLAQMQRAGRRRDREIDVMAETLRESSRRQAETSVQIGQALERQGQALAELLRRSAPSA